MIRDREEHIVVGDERNAVLSYQMLRVIDQAFNETELSSLEAEYISHCYPGEPLPVKTTDAILSEVLRRDTDRGRT